MSKSPVYHRMFSEAVCKVGIEIKLTIIESLAQLQSLELDGITLFVIDIDMMDDIDEIYAYVEEIIPLIKYLVVGKRKNFSSTPFCSGQVQNVIFVEKLLSHSYEINVIALVRGLKIGFSEKMTPVIEFKEQAILPSKIIVDEAMPLRKSSSTN